jgi:hypothetical protein
MILYDSDDLITINVPLILKVLESPGYYFFFAGSGQFRGQKVSAPSKNPVKFLIICFAPDQNTNFQGFQNQRYIGIFMYQ